MHNEQLADLIDRPAGGVKVISKELLDILVCPACKTKVTLEGERLVCATCGRKYPIRNGIPVMLIEEGDKALAEDKDN